MLFRSARCDRISFMHKGRVLAVGTPAELAARQNAPDLEEAFVQYLIEAEGGEGGEGLSRQEAAHSESDQRELLQNTDGVREPSSHTLRDNPNTDTFKYRFSMIWTFARREAKELLRDKIRLFFAVFGPLIIMASVSWGISFDVRNLKFAVYDRDQTAASRELEIGRAHV